MAMQLDLTTVFKTKYVALGAGDKTYKMQAYIKTIIATAASAARKDINTRVWNDLPKT